MKPLARVVLGIVLWPALAWGQVDMELSVSAPAVEVGDTLRVVLKAMGGSEAPSDPDLTLPAGLTKSRPRVGSQQQVSIINGRIQQSVGLSATWIVRAERAGRYVVGPARVSLGGRVFQSRTARLEVVAQGKLPKARRPSRRSPFSGNPFDPFDLDPFGPGSPFPNFDRLFDHSADLLDYPPELATDHAPDSVAFVRSTLDPQTVVLGQQVTLRVYAYDRRGPIHLTPVRTPKHPDFFSISHEEQSRGYRVPIGDGVWHAQQIHEVALFPLRAGRLTVKGMEVEFGSRLRNSPGLLRRSSDLEVVVHEPPVDGRAPGYQLGDVGQYELGAQVRPRSIDAGGSVSVIAQLQGRGNLPHQLLVPEQNGVDWLEPTVTSDINFDGDRVSGTRTFSYVVRLLEPGQIELGELSLPYYNPQRHRYEVARATLGTVQVKAAPGQLAGEDAKLDENPEVDLGKLVEPRRKLDRVAGVDAYLADSMPFWLLLVAAPLSVGLGAIALAFGRRLSAERRERKSSAQTRAKAAAKEAEHARKAGDLPRAIAATERALYLAIEAGTGIKGRAVVKAELEGHLIRAGVDEKLAGEGCALLEQCDTLRFAGGSADRVAELVRQAVPIARRLSAQAMAGDLPRAPADGSRAP